MLLINNKIPDINSQEYKLFKRNVEKNLAHMSFDLHITD